MGISDCNLHYGNSLMNNGRVEYRLL